MFVAGLALSLESSARRELHNTMTQISDAIRFGLHLFKVGMFSFKICRWVSQLVPSRQEISQSISMRDLEEEQQNESSGRKSISAAKGAEGVRQTFWQSFCGFTPSSKGKNGKGRERRRRERPKKNIIEKSSVGEFAVDRIHVI